MRTLQLAAALVLLVGCLANRSELSVDDEEFDAMAGPMDSGFMDPTPTPDAGPVERGEMLGEDDDAGPVDSGEEAPVDSSEKDQEPEPQSAESASTEADSSDVETVSHDAATPVVPAPASEDSVPEVDDEPETNRADLSMMDNPGKDQSLGNRPGPGLDRILKQRKGERLPRDFEEATHNRMRMQAEYEVDQKNLKEAQDEVQSLEGKKETLTKRKQQAVSEARAAESKIQQLHDEVSDQAGALAKAKQRMEEARGMHAAATIQEEIQDTYAGAGGFSDSDENDPEDEVALTRESNKEEYALSVNATINAGKAADEADAQVQALSSKYHQLDAKRVKLNDELYDADHKMAGATYDLGYLKKETAVAKEKLAQRQAVAKIGEANYESAKKAEAAAKAAVERHTEGIEDMYSAEALAPDLRRENAVKNVMDQDGLDDNGKPLVAPKGEVSKQYVELWNSMPTPKQPANALLDAAAAAALAP